ncbi:MAG: F0F1 ATP synthase subunit B [Cohaesibacteraceae bacterium]|nr:F0F1 ATP synthase subunit B [Cohaesibacteraceae bacterium]
MASNTHTEVAGGNGDDGGAFPPFDTSTFGSQLLWLAITFGLLYYIMSKIALPRIADILEVRRDRIANDLAEAERLKSDTDQAIASYEQALSEARKKAIGIGSASREKVKGEIEAERAKVEADANAKLAKAETNIAQVKAQAMGELDEIAHDTTEALVKELIGGRVAKKEIADALATVRAN